VNTSTISDLLQLAERLPSSINLEFDGVTYAKRCLHSVKPPLSEESRATAFAKVNAAGTRLQHLYAACNGGKFFFSSTDETESGEYFIPPISILSVGKIPKRTQELLEDIEEIPIEDRPKYAGGIAFAEALGTGNLFVLMPNGPFEGNIFYCDHDPDGNDWPNRPFAKSLDEFLRKIFEPPFSAIADIFGATRVWA
jgi:hypothetical protein